MLKPLFHHCFQNEMPTWLQCNPPTPGEDPEPGEKSQCPALSCSDLVIRSMLSAPSQQLKAFLPI